MAIFSRRLVAKERGIYYIFSVFVLSSFGQCSFGSNSHRTSNNRDITLFFRAVFEFISHSNKLCILGLESVNVVSAYRVTGYAEYCSSGRVFCS